MEPGGVPRDTLESVQGTPEATAWIFFRFLGVPGPLVEAIWRHIGVPMATCGDCLGAPAGAKGHKKAGSGQHSVSNEVSRAIVDSPGVALRDENTENNMFISKTAPSPICSRRVAQRDLKASFWSPFGHFGPSRNGLLTTLGATERQQDAALCTDAFPSPKVVPDDPLQNELLRQGRRECGG